MQALVLVPTLNLANHMTWATRTLITPTLDILEKSKNQRGPSFDKIVHCACRVKASISVPCLLHGQRCINRLLWHT